MPHRLSANYRDSDYRRIVVDSPLVALELGVADLLSGVDTLIARGMVDPEMMALVGFSNEGGAVAHIVARTDRFGCALIQSPAAGGNWGSRFFDDPDGIYFQVMLGDRTPWNAPLLYAALSPVYHADRIRTPLLLAVGEVEDFGWVHNAIQLYGALRRLWRPVTLVRDCFAEQPFPCMRSHAQLGRQRERRLDGRPMNVRVPNIEVIVPEARLCTCRCACKEQWDRVVVLPTDTATERVRQ